MLIANEPVPFVNPHPISASHFNPIMEGTKDRMELAYKHSSYHEQGYVDYDGETYIRNMDFESSELSLFYKKSYCCLSFSLDAGATHNHEGFLDNAIVYIHDRTGSTGGEWKKRKEAPRNEYHFSLYDVSGNEVFNEDRRWVYKFNAYLGVKLPWGLYLRGGVKPPIQKHERLLATTDYEYAATIQKSGGIGDLDMILDFSNIWTAQDSLDLEVKKNRMAANLFVACRGYYIQLNYVESVYSDTERGILDAFGGVYTFGYRGKNWFWGISEDFSAHNSPDISLMVGLSF